MRVVGLDIGSNSVGSAWIDTEKRTVRIGVSVFPAGVEETEAKRGEPKNKRRREKRSLRRSIGRRARRRHALRRFLLEHGLMPEDKQPREQWNAHNPWVLRRKALKDPLTPEEFGRVLLHMAQRRGPVGVETDPEDQEEGKIKEAMDGLSKAIKESGAATYGAFMAELFEQRKENLESSKKHKPIYYPIRNRSDAFGQPTYEFCPSRDLIIDEFKNIWAKQAGFDGPLAELLTDELKAQLYDPGSNDIWRSRGLLFGQRNTYWRTGTLGRCDLEPTDRCCPKADRHAQEYLVLETVNNIRLHPRGRPGDPLTPEQRQRVIQKLRSTKKASPASVRRALGLNRKVDKELYDLNIERDKDRPLNTDWFYREVVGALGQEAWEAMDEDTREGVNRAILHFDPQDPRHRRRFADRCPRWWNLSDEQADALVQAWQTRPKLEDRLNLSRRAVLNVLPYMRQGLTQIEARKRFAEDSDSGATDAQRRRYALNPPPRTKAQRHFAQKHPDLLPPAPELSNPVVRKAIHEVRRHINAYLQEFGSPPDRVVIELARQARQSAAVRNKQLAANRARQKERNDIIEKHNLASKTRTQQARAVERVLLWRQQQGHCAYSNPDRMISEDGTAQGHNVEIDHIVPLSRSQDNALSNKVLCIAAANRGKGNQTPREWLSQEDYQAMCQRFQYWRKEDPRKWENLHREAPSIDDFVASQLTDTAYASRQVAGWLRTVLYGGELRGRRGVLTTKGSYTAILRRDWGLYADDQRPFKDRGDHREHALDAVAIALTGPKRIAELAHAAEAVNLARDAGHSTPRRKPLDAPWATADSFRADVLKPLGELVVSHRPVNRRITRHLHMDTMYGPVLSCDAQGTRKVEPALVTKCIVAGELKPAYLKVPQGWDTLREKLDNPGLTKGKRRAIRRDMLALPDVKPGKGGIVRDRWLREELRAALCRGGLDLDNFTKQEIRALLQQAPLTLASGVPVKRVKLLVSMKETVRRPRKYFDVETGRVLNDNNPAHHRIWESQNNHHIEIREDPGNGKWIGDVVKMIDAAERVRGKPPKPAVDRSDNTKGRFVMSLAMGEMVDMKHKETGQRGFFVVYKIASTKKIHFKNHWDARPQKPKEDIPPFEDISCSPLELQKLGLEPCRGPQKVRVDVLGRVSVLQGD